MKTFELIEPTPLVETEGEEILTLTVSSLSKGTDGFVEREFDIVFEGDVVVVWRFFIDPRTGERKPYAFMNSVVISLI